MPNNGKRTRKPALLSRVEKLEDLNEELLTALGVTTQAINRLETFTFSLVKVLKDKDLVTLEGLGECMDSLHAHENLGDFWDAEIPDKPLDVVQPAEDEVVLEGTTT